MAQKNFIEKLLDVERKEWRTLIWLMLFMFTESIASEILNIIALSDFVKGMGVRGIPVLYIFDEVLLSTILALYAILQTRIERTKLFNLFEAVFGSIILFLWLGFKASVSPAIIGIATYAVKSLATSIVEEIFWQYVDEIYDVRESKRLTSVITTSGNIGSMVGDAVLGILIPFLGPPESAPQSVQDSFLNMFRLVAPLVMFSGIFFMIRVKSAAIAEGRIKDKSQKKDKPEKKKKKKEDKKPTFKDGLAFLKSSPMFSAIFFTFVVAGVVAPLGDFVFQATIDLYAKDKKAYATFFSIYSLSLQIFLFVANLFLSGRLMKRVGLSNSQLFTPVNNIFKFLAVIPTLGTKLGLWAAVYSQGTKKILEKIIQKPAQRILFGFAPKKQKNVVRVFTKQMKGYAAIFTLLTLFGLLLVPAPAAGHAASAAGAFGRLYSKMEDGTRLLFIRVVAGILVGLSAFWLLQAMKLKRVFAESLVQILQTQEVDFESLEREDFRGLIDRKTIMFLWKNLEAGSDKRAVFIIEVLGEMADARLLRPIAELMPQKGPEVRRALVKLAGRIGGDEARPFLVNALKSREPGVRAEALKAIGDNGYTGVYENVRPLIDDDDEEVRVAAAAITLHSQDVDLRKEGARVLDAMLRSDDTRRRVNGIYLLGQMGVRRNIRSVLPFLEDPDAEVRLEALKALHALEDGSDHGNVLTVSALLEDAHQDVRAEAARVLGKIGSPEATAPLLKTLSQRGFAARKAAIASLAALSNESREELVNAVANPEVDLATKELILKELRHSDAEDRVCERLVPILSELLKGIYGRIGDRAALDGGGTHGPGKQLLLKSIADLNHETRDLVLSIMIILADPEHYKLIRKGLLTGDKSSKANMLELLESNSERSVFNLLLPLLDDMADEDRLAIGKKTWDLNPKDAEAALRECLRSTDSSIRLAAIYCASEEGLKGFAKELQTLGASRDPATSREARRALAQLS
ncbi:MAG: Npt1/Npt2 family nucleotide transporter [Acidobacteriota bacterium]